MKNKEKINKEEIIDLGTKLGLMFNLKTNFPDALDKGRVVFDGHNGQRFLIESDWGREKVLQKLGESLILMGKREKTVEISRVLSINQD